MHASKEVLSRLLYYFLHFLHFSQLFYFFTNHWTVTLDVNRIGFSSTGIDGSVLDLFLGEEDGGNHLWS